MAIDIFAIFVPCWQVLKHQTLQKETLDTIAAWEARKKQESVISGYFGSPKIADSFTGASRGRSSAEKLSFDSSFSDSIFTMDALERQLQRDPEPLRQFSALRDFSGENIAFLTSIAKWKAMWPDTPASWDSHKGTGGQLSQRELFRRAVRIYANYVSRHLAEFPVNLSARDLQKLEYVFEDAACVLYGESRENSMSSVIPFDEHYLSKSPGISNERVSQIGDDTDLVDLINERVQYWGEISRTFNMEVFDQAEKNVKYLVLTNTWPKFVKEMRGRPSLEVSQRSLDASPQKSQRYWPSWTSRGSF